MSPDWTWNRDWQDLTQEEQEFLKENFPEIALDLIFRFPRKESNTNDHTN